MTAALYTLKDVLASSRVAEEIAKRFIGSEIAVYPTETIYGIGGRADDQSVKFTADSHRLLPRSF